MTTSPLLSTDVVAKAQQFPRLRYMGSKYRLLPHLERTFADIGGSTAVDAFSGSGVVSYLRPAVCHPHPILRPPRPHRPM
ncbi:type IIs modification methyltransferase [Rhodococcus aetherivorans]|nr:type IIs modification methyltransferase [Rhodococcus aetherivorans]